VALDRFVTPDENLWLSRSANFYFALGQRDFAATYQKEHPGVTVMWAGTAAFLARFPGYRGSGLGQVESDQFHYYIYRVKETTPLALLTTARLILLIGHTLVLGLSYWFARELVGTFPALLGFLLVAFDPFHISLTRILHLDGLSSNLMLLSLLAFLSYQRQRGMLSLATSGIAAGLAWLTKSPSFFLIPIVGILTLWDVGKQIAIPGSGSMWRRLWVSVWPAMLWAGFAALVFVAIWPAMWVTPAHALSQVFSQAEGYAVRGHFSPIFYQGKVFEDGNIGPAYLGFYVDVFLWRSTPVVILGVLLAFLGFATRIGSLRKPEVRHTVLGLALIMAVFYVGLTFSAKKFDRYFLPAIVPADVLAGIGWAAFFAWINQRNALRIIPMAGFTLLVGLQLALALGTYPYYSTYFNPLLGGSRKAVEVLQIGWGEGIDQAARYLNEKKNAEDLHVISWYANGSFSYYFKGHVRWMGYQSEMSDGAWDKFITSDYAVIYVNQWQRHTPQPILDYVSRSTPKHVVTLNGLEYVRIYKIR
jgi:hypothetical protein